MRAVQTPHETPPHERSMQPDAGEDTGSGTARDTAMVLVPGAWEDASVWDGVVAELAGRVRAIRAVELPATSLAADIARVREHVAALGGPVVLVGHSYGGSVISGAAHEAPGVEGLVFVAAYAPECGESVAALSERGAAMPGGEAIRWGRDGWTDLDPARFADVLGADLPPARTAALAAAQRPAHLVCLTAPSGPVGWPELPCAAVVATDDRILDPGLQRWMADRAGATVTELPASHLVPLSRAAEVARACTTLAM